MCSILEGLCSQARIPLSTAPRVGRFGGVGTDSSDELGPVHHFKCHT